MILIDHYELHFGKRYKHIPYPMTVEVEKLSSIRQGLRSVYPPKTTIYLYYKTLPDATK